VLHITHAARFGIEQFVPDDAADPVSHRDTERSRKQN
jgi:hypothetical protein